MYTMAGRCSPLRVVSTIGTGLLFSVGASYAAPQPPPAAASVTVPQWQTTTVSEAQIMEATDRRKGGRPRQFAIGLSMPLTPADGAWVMQGQTAVWRVRIHSADALALSFALADVSLPQGAALTVYDPKRRVVQGPYRRADVTTGGMLWTAMVPGDTAIIEVDVPAGDEGALKLRVHRVFHAFALPGAHAVPEKVSGTSGSCEINVACPAGAAWTNEARAVAMITIAGSFECTATLVNDVPGDNTPYLLTANHCGIGQPDEPASSVIAYWNYQAATCAGTSGSMADSQTGATLLASDAASDFALLQLDQAPPAAYNVHYAGWNVGATPPQHGVTIHQPENDIKKISVYDVAPTPGQVALGTAGNLVEVWQVNWAQGATEDGSSGAPLLDQNGAVVGVLSGGFSSCATPTATDDFGRLDAAWTGNADPADQLKTYLDPADTGVITLCGRDPDVQGCGTSSGGGSSGGSGSSGGGSSSGGSSGGNGSSSGGSGSSSGGSGSGGNSRSGGGGPTPGFLAVLALAACLRRRAPIRR